MPLAGFFKTTIYYIVGSPLGSRPANRKAGKCYAQHSKTPHLPYFGHCALETAVLWPLCARTGCAVATVRSKWVLCAHFALEMAVLWPLCARNGVGSPLGPKVLRLDSAMTVLENTAHAVLWLLYARNGCAVATVRSKWLRCGHCALEMAVLWPLCARNGCRRGPLRPRNGRAEATVRSKWLRCGHCALEMAALWPLCARFDCAYLSFGVTVLLRAVLCAA